jgi:hypothetical protein
VTLIELIGAIVIFAIIIFPFLKQAKKYVTWFYGTTGKYKTSLSCCLLSFYGEFDTQTPSETWRSTFNNIEKRGFIREGYFADLTILDLNTSWTVSHENILSKCGWSPLEGTKFQTKVTHTFVNGNLIYDHGLFNETINGKALTKKNNLQ